MKDNRIFPRETFRGAEIAARLAEIEMKRIQRGIAGLVDVALPGTDVMITLHVPPHEKMIRLIVEKEREK